MNILKFATAECQTLLPQVMVDYLWKLAAENAPETQTFVLSGKDTGVGPLQEILHRRPGHSEWFQVFGYEPVDAAIEVRFTDLGAIMSVSQQNERVTARDSVAVLIS